MGDLPCPQTGKEARLQVGGQRRRGSFVQMVEDAHRLAKGIEHHLAIGQSAR
jgi:hypothetical protein